MWLGTIGYEGTTMDAFLRTLSRARVDLLVDVRAVASSRRPGFSKTRLAENLGAAGIEYLHLRGLGTPADGRAAARAGRAGEMRKIYGAHLRTEDAQGELDALVDLVEGGRRVCVLCFEASVEQCHRLLVADAVSGQVSVAVEHLRPQISED
jgi:uncharacterized protein (DUF488 family)